MNNTELNSKGLRIFVAAVLLMTLAAVICFAVMIVRLYEPQIQYFAYKAVIPVIFQWVMVAVTIAVFTFPFVYFKKGELNNTLPDSSLPQRIVSLVCAVLLISASVYSLIDYSKTSAELSNMYSGLPYTPNTETSPVLLIATSVVAFVSSFYFIGGAIRKKTADRSLAVMGCLLIVWTILYQMRLYYSYVSPYNSPLRVMNQLAFIGFMIFSVYEMRYRFTDSRPRLFLSFTSLAVIFCTTSSVARLIGTLDGVLEFGESTFYDALLLFLSAYMILRLLSFISQNNTDKKSVAAESEPEKTE